MGTVKRPSFEALADAADGTAKRMRFTPGLGLPPLPAVTPSAPPPPPPPTQALLPVRRRDPRGGGRGGDGACVISQEAVTIWRGVAFDERGQALMPTPVPFSSAEVYAPAGLSFDELFGR